METAFTLVMIILMAIAFAVCLMVGGILLCIILGLFLFAWPYTLVLGGLIFFPAPLVGAVLIILALIGGVLSGFKFDEQ